MKKRKLVLKKDRAIVLSVSIPSRLLRWLKLESKHRGLSLSGYIQKICFDAQAMSSVENVIEHPERKASRMFLELCSTMARQFNESDFSEDDLKAMFKMNLKPIQPSKSKKVGS